MCFEERWPTSWFTFVHNSFRKKDIDAPRFQRKYTRLESCRERVNKLYDIQEKEEGNGMKFWKGRGSLSRTFRGMKFGEQEFGAGSWRIQGNSGIKGILSRRYSRAREQVAAPKLSTRCIPAATAAIRLGSRGNTVYPTICKPQLVVRHALFPDFQLFQLFVIVDHESLGTSSCLDCLYL